MEIIVCLDERNGMLFNHRRVSKDAAVIADIAAFVSGKTILADSYSAQLFASSGVTVSVSDYPLDAATKNDICFVEREDISSFSDQIHKVVIYWWNRAYPSDKKFPMELFCDRWKLESSFKFAGNSHDEITREVYIL